MIKKTILIVSVLTLLAGCNNKTSEGNTGRSNPADTTVSAVEEIADEKTLAAPKVKYYFRANGGSAVFFDDGTACVCARCEFEDLTECKPNATYEEFPNYLLIDRKNKWELFDESGRVTIDWVIVNYNTVFVNEENEIEYLNTGYYENLNQIGLGVVNPKDFHFYFITDTTNIQKTKIEDIEKQAFFIPLIWKPDYGIFYMTVVGISENWYEVQASAKTTVWVDKREFDFYTWENLLKKTTCIIANTVYKEKNIHSETADMREYEAVALTVEKVEGDWIFVKGEHLHIENAAFDYSWVRWKDENNKLLIRPIFLM